MNWELEPKLLRARVRAGKWVRPTSGLCPNFVQANVVVLPKEYAFDFLLFCYRNPKPCPVLEVGDVGNPILTETAKAADIRTDVPAYLIFENGRLVREVTDLNAFWEENCVFFLLGCSHTFDAILDQNRFVLPHFVEKKTPPVFTTNISCKPAGMFAGPLVVSGRSILATRVAEVINLTSRFELAHGAPIHVGNPKDIGINDVTQAEYGGMPLTVGAGEVPVFWACGVTPQAVALAAEIPKMITHKPGHMFVSDLTVAQLARYSGRGYTAQIGHSGSDLCTQSI